MNYPMIGSESNTAYPQLTDSLPHFMRVTQVNETKARGRIIKISNAGWGFISSKDIQFTRIFFHWTALRQDSIPFLELKTGMTVEFTPIQIPGKGYRAVHVRVIEREKPSESSLSTLSQ